MSSLSLPKLCVLHWNMVILRLILLSKCSVNS